MFKQRPQGKCDLCSFSACPHPPDVSTVRLGGEAGLHPVQPPVERLIFLALHLECTAKYVYDGWPGSSFQGGCCSCSREKSEASGLDLIGTFVLCHVCHLMGRILVVSRQAGLEPIQVTCKL